MIYFHNVVVEGTPVPILGVSGTSVHTVEGYHGYSIVTIAMGTKSLVLYVANVTPQIIAHGVAGASRARSTVIKSPLVTTSKVALEEWTNTHTNLVGLT